MANPRQVKLLKLGVAAWNQWREEEPDIWPDLIAAPLRGLCLDGVNLENTNLHRVDLESSSLVDARLRNANLKDSILASANLQGANLRESNLYSSDLRDANLTGADLRDANLNRARFDGTQLYKSTFESTGFDSGLLLGGAGIDTIYHKDAWSVDIGILQETARLVAEKPYLHERIVGFFRNAQVPEHLLLEHFGAAGNVGMTCFVSYSHQDKDFADVLCAKLKDRDVHYWRDTHSEIAIGSDILNELTRAIVGYDKVLLCCSRFSLTSSWVHEEVGVALDKEKKLQRNVLLPLDIDGFLWRSWTSPYAPMLKQRFVADFVGWREDICKLASSLDRVIRVLRPT